tara:strand:- start:268 stop:699 length:432 start_codon:yes stop_codon:yes gene_type:complete
MPKKTLFRRKREGKTDYNKRLNLLKYQKPRLVIRKSLNNVSIQFIDYIPTGDKVLISTHSNQLKKLGWKSHKGNVSSAYLTGLIGGLKAKSKNIETAVLDLGLNPSIKGSVLYAALQGVLDAELEVPHSKEVLPPKKKIRETI